MLNVFFYYKKSSVRRLKNITPEIAIWLKTLGIRTKEDLEDYGSLQAYKMLKEAGLPVTRTLVYALEGALLNTKWDILPEQIKQDLNKQIDSL